MAGWFAAMAILAAGTAPAQAPPVATDLDVARGALVSAKQAAAAAEARADALNQAAAQAGNEADRARARAQALGQQVQAAEADIAASRARIALIAGLQAAAHQHIVEKHGPLVHLIAALQTMARRPPALAIAQPGSVNDIIHVRLLLADTLPVIQARTASLRADLARQTVLRGDTERAMQALNASRTLLGKRRQELALVEATAIRKSQRLADQAADESQRALGLGEEARDIADRMQTLTDAGDVRARLEQLPAPLPRPSEGPGDRVPVHDGDPRYRLPVSGDVTTGFGDVSQSGVTARGLTLAVAPDAQVVAPHAGTVVFAAPFRSYGKIVILAHGGGWTTTVTGLDSLAVKAGDTVRPGTPIGRAGSDKPHVTTELRRDNRPIDVLAMAQAG